MSDPGFHFPVQRRLKHRRLFEALFSKGKRTLKHPVLCMYQEVELPEDVPVQVGFVAPKKHYRKAVQRNQVKRWLREAYRQHASDFETHVRRENKQLALLFITLKSDNISYELVRDKLVLLLRALEEEIRHDK